MAQTRRAEPLSSYRRPGETLSKTRDRLAAVIAQADEEMFRVWLRFSSGGRSVFRRSTKLFDSEEAAMHWMRRSMIELDGYSVRDLLRTRKGERVVVDVLKILLTLGPTSGADERHPAQVLLKLPLKLNGKPEIDERNSPDEAVEVREEREACARLLELTNSEIRLVAGEIEPDEMQTIQAILSWRARAIRARGAGLPSSPPS